MRLFIPSQGLFEASPNKARDGTLEENVIHSLKSATQWAIGIPSPLFSFSELHQFAAYYGMLAKRILAASLASYSSKALLLSYQAHPESQESVHRFGGINTFLLKSPNGLVR
jgi:hypothetical protein